MSEPKLITLGELPTELCAEFERCFDIRFGRRATTREIPGAFGVRSVCVLPCWPEAHIKRMKDYFNGWQDSRKRSTSAMATQAGGTAV
jgi:hypothetical protein